MANGPGSNTPGRNPQANNNSASASRSTPGRNPREGQDTGFDFSSIGRGISSFAGDAFDTGSKIASNIGNEITSAFGLASESRKKDIQTDPTQQASSATVQWRSTINNPDWRVKLSLPSQFSADNLLAPLKDNNGLVFPYTPTIILGYTANYNSLQPVHTNYPFQIYENSSVQEIVITGDFTVENAADGQYWIAAIHYLRSVTKMFYGNGENSGQPPPRVKLNGYGDYVFNNVPCVVTNFTVDLPADVDYISVPMNVTAPTDGDGRTSAAGQGVAWVPSSSLITVTVQPTYSRTTVSKFNLNDFVNGSYITNNGGFI